MPTRIDPCRALLIEMMDEFEIANLDRLSETIVDASREATLAHIHPLPHCISSGAKSSR